VKLLALAKRKEGLRKSGPSGHMPLVASTLSDGDISGLAAYIAAQPTPLLKAAVSK
jgi:cytochrome c553